MTGGEEEVAPAPEAEHAPGFPTVGGERHQDLRGVVFNQTTTSGMDAECGQSGDISVGCDFQHLNCAKATCRGVSRRS